MLLQKEIIELYVSIPTDQHFENPSDFRTETYHLTYIEFAKVFPLLYLWRELRDNSTAYCDPRFLMTSSTKLKRRYKLPCIAHMGGQKRKLDQKPVQRHESHWRLQLCPSTYLLQPRTSIWDFAGVSKTTPSWLVRSDTPPVSNSSFCQFRPTRPVSQRFDQVKQTSKCPIYTKNNKKQQMISWSSDTDLKIGP